MEADVFIRKGGVMHWIEVVREIGQVLILIAFFLRQNHPPSE